MQLFIQTSPIQQNPNARFATKSRVYVSPVGETVVENMRQRRSRPLNTYRDVLRQGLDQMGVDLSKIEYKWSQKAGCGCGCSPGFIIDGWDPNIAGKNVFIGINSFWKE